MFNVVGSLGEYVTVKDVAAVGPPLAGVRYTVIIRELVGTVNPVEAHKPIELLRVVARPTNKEGVWMRTLGGPPVSAKAASVEVPVVAPVNSIALPPGVKDTLNVPPEPAVGAGFDAT